MCYTRLLWKRFAKETQNSFPEQSSVFRVGTHRSSPSNPCHTKDTKSPEFRAHKQINKQNIIWLLCDFQKHNLKSVHFLRWLVMVCVLCTLAWVYHCSSPQCYIWIDISGHTYGALIGLRTNLFHSTLWWALRVMAHGWAERIIFYELRVRLLLIIAC